jgi:hypothetical protein
MARAVAWTDDQLRAAVASSTSYVGVLRKLGLKSNGGSQYAIQRRINELRLDVSHFKSKPVDATFDARLADAVRRSTSYDEVVDAMGLEPSPASYEKVQRRTTMLGLPRDHFEVKSRGRMRTVRRTWTDETLRAAVTHAPSFAQVMRNLGLIPAGGNYDVIQRRIRDLGLDTSHFTGKRWNKGWVFDPRPHTPLGQVLVANRWTNSHVLKKRLIRAGLKPEHCELCGWAERAPDGRIPLELDHINGDKTDNRLENLRIVCPNCHALQPTHRGLNKKSRRGS